MVGAVRRIAFVHSGEFSHINEGVLRALKTGFPHAVIDTFDTHELPVWRRYRQPLMLVDAFAAYGARAIHSRDAIRRFGQRTAGFFDATRRQLHSLLQRAPYDFTLQTQSIVDASQPGIPHFVYTDHTHLANSYYPTFDRRDLYSPDWIERERGIYGNARTTFTMSSHVTRSLVEHYALDPSRILRVGVGSNVAIPEASALPVDRYAGKCILFVGVDWERKGGPQLLAAFAALLAHHPDARLKIIGCSPDVRQPRVEVLGRLPLSEVGRHYRDAAVFCMPTRNEPFGVVFLEAAAYRLPVVATDLGALPDLVADGVNGYLVAPDDVAGLTDRLGRLLASPAMGRRFGEAGFERMLADFTWPRVGERMTDRIRQELAGTMNAAVAVTPPADDPGSR